MHAPPDIPLKNHIAGIILAGGKSSRMGIDKKDIIFQGTTFLVRMHTLLRSCGIQNIWVSGQTDAYPCIPDPSPFPGPAQAITHAIHQLPLYNHFMIVPVDMPFLTTDILGLLMSYQHGAYFMGFPLPAYICRRALNWNDVSIKDVLKTSDAEKVDIPEKYISKMKNINNKEDLEGAFHHEP